MNSAPKAQQSGQIVYRPWSILSVPSKNIKCHRSLPTKPLSARDQHRLSVALNKPVKFPGKSSRLTEKQQSAIAKRYGEHDEFFRSAIAVTNAANPFHQLRFINPRTERVKELRRLESTSARVA